MNGFGTIIQIGDYLISEEVGDHRLLVGNCDIQAGESPGFQKRLQFLRPTPFRR